MQQDVESIGLSPSDINLATGGSYLHRLHTTAFPHFADRAVEAIYRRFQGRELVRVQRFFATAVSGFTLILWIYHITSRNGIDMPAIVGLIQAHCAVAITWAIWAILSFVTYFLNRSSILHVCQNTLLASLFCWMMPLTARETCSDMYRSYDVNLQQAAMAVMCYAAVFCKMDAGSFLVLCMLVMTNYLVSQLVWSMWEGHHFVVAFEAPKLFTIFAILYFGVRRNDMLHRRDFFMRMTQSHQVEQLKSEKERLGWDFALAHLSATASGSLPPPAATQTGSLAASAINAHEFRVSELPCGTEAGAMRTEAGTTRTDLGATRMEAGANAPWVGVGSGATTRTHDNCTMASSLASSDDVRTSHSLVNSNGNMELAAYFDKRIQHTIWRGLMIAELLRAGARQSSSPLSRLSRDVVSLISRHLARHIQLMICRMQVYKHRPQSVIEDRWIDGLGPIAWSSG
mmetsp:Transcript_43413/g.72179  ORF Transcript_43413/g.72179 Transcript_43413/m.72179 type:complete len:458 (+) Transcript_43413:146-1519(+)